MILMDCVQVGLKIITVVTLKQNLINTYINFIEDEDYYQKMQQAKKNIKQLCDRCNYGNTLLLNRKNAIDLIQIKCSNSVCET